MAKNNYGFKAMTRPPRPRKPGDGPVPIKPNKPVKPKKKKMV